MHIVKTLTPAEEIIRDLTTHLSEMSEAANNDILREKERSEQRCNDRWRRMHDETRDLRAQRDAMLKAWSDAQMYTAPVIVPENI